MDDERRRALDLIESAVGGVSRDVRGAQLVHVARDYVEDGDVLRARTVLAKIEVEYFERDLPVQVATDSLLAEALAVLVDCFGADLVLARRPAGES